MQPDLMPLNAVLRPPPWKLQGDAFIANYWLSPALIRQAADFQLAPSPLGRMVQVACVRYRESPVGPYDELLILDHALLTQRRLNTIPKIYVSTEISVQHGQQYWGIPKELAAFEWHEQNNEIRFTVHFSQQSMSILFTKQMNPQILRISSNCIPSLLLNIQQDWHNKHYQFTPQFRGHLSRLASVQWKNTQSIFPDFSQARYLQGFAVPEFDLIFPEAQIKQK